MGAQTGLVTGATGYIALHLVNQLLEAGWTVHGTVRSLKNEEKTKPLRTLSDLFPGKLQLFEADLLKEGSFLEGMQGCDVVFHVASPFIVPEKVKDPQKEFVEPALQGTKNVLESVNQTTSVKRVVLTSSIGAVYADKAEVLKMENQTVHESYYAQECSIDHNPYQLSKVLAEKEAWKIAEAQGRWDLVTINPGMVFGPPLSTTYSSGSIDLIEQLMGGQFFIGVPDLHFDLVDVRDVATAHIRAAELPTARGRYIVATSHTVPIVELSKTLRKVHKRPWLLPTWKLPNFLFRLVGPLLGLTQKWLTANLSISFDVDVSRSKEELGLKYRTIEEMLTDHYHQYSTGETALTKKKDE